MPNGLHTIEDTIQTVRKSVKPSTTPEAAGTGAGEAIPNKVLLNFLDGLSGQIKAFCFAWTGDETFDKPKNP